MKKTQPYTHPVTLYNKKIKEEGIIVFDDVRGLPTTSEPYISPDYVICIGHRGNINIMYDDYADFFEKYSVAVIFPNHKLVRVNSSDDYLSTLIVVDVAMLNDPMLQIIKYLRYRYEPHPCVKLEREEYNKIMNVVEVMKETLNINIPERRTFLARQLEFFLRLLSYYRRRKLVEIHTEKRVSLQFHNNLLLYSRQYHNVDFYAKKACLSTKHFSTVIKQETGFSAVKLIHTHIVAEAKMLLHMRSDLSIQTISDMLGFNEQSSFTRYFKRETGISPTEFREMSALENGTTE